MKEIRYADFDLSEYRHRVQRLRDRMEAEGLDALVITDPANLRYVFGFQNLLQLSATRMFVGLLPREDPDQAILFLPHDSQGAPQSWVERIVFWDEGHEPPFDDRLADVESVAAALRRLGLVHGRLGLELGPGTRPGIPAAQFDRLRSLLPAATLLDCSSVLWAVRRIKSEAEIALLSRIAQISADALQYARGLLREGLSERELYREIYAELFRRGADGQGLLCVQFGADGWTRANMTPTDHRRLRDNEWAYLDGGGSLQGYHADLCRMAVLGASTPRHQAMLEAVSEAQQAIMAAAAPGVPCSELYRVGTDLLRSRGLGDALDSLSVGHGIGLNVHEMPDLNLHNHEPLEAGMVLSIEPWLLDRSPAAGLFNLEDMIVVREGGAQVLSA